MDTRTCISSQILAASALTVTAAPVVGLTLDAQTDRVSFYSRGARVDVKRTEAYLDRLELALGQRLEGRDVDDVARPNRSLLAAVVSSFGSLPQEVAYPIAGSFVAWLIDAHGIVKVMTFFRSCRKPSQAPAIFERTFGERLDVAGDRWAAAV